MVDAMAYGLRRTPSSRARSVGSSCLPQASPRTHRRLPCADHHADERSFSFTASSSAIRARLDPSMPGHGRDEPRRREVRAETLDLVPLRRRAPSYRHRLELGRDWAEPRRRGHARRLGASHAAVAAGVPRRSLALALLLDTVASVPLNLLNRGAKMRKCLRSQKLKTTFPRRRPLPDRQRSRVLDVPSAPRGNTRRGAGVPSLAAPGDVPHAVMNL